MSEDEQRLEKSKLLLEWTENKQELGRRRAVAARMGESFASVAACLRSEPETLIFPGETTPIQYTRQHKNNIRDVSALDLTEVKNVRDAIRGLEDRQAELGPRLVAFGLPV